MVRNCCISNFGKVLEVFSRTLKVRLFFSLLWGPVITLHDCLAAFFSADELKGENMYSCEKCQKLAFHIVCPNSWCNPFSAETDTIFMFTDYAMDWRSLNCKNCLKFCASIWNDFDTSICLVPKFQRTSLSPWKDCHWRPSWMMPTSLQHMTWCQLFVTMDMLLVSCTSCCKNANMLYAFKRLTCLICHQINSWSIFHAVLRMIKSSIITGKGKFSYLYMQM